MSRRGACSRRAADRNAKPSRHAPSGAKHRGHDAAQVAMRDGLAIQRGSPCEALGASNLVVPLPNKELLLARKNMRVARFARGKHLGRAAEFRSRWAAQGAAGRWTCLELST